MATWPNLDARLDAVRVPHGKPTFPQTECGVACGHSATSLHPLGRARDYGNIDTPGGNSGCDRIYNEFIQFAVGANYLLQELFWNPIGCWQRGRRIGPVTGHWNHVHAGLAAGALLPIPSGPAQPPPPPFVEELLLYG